MKTSKKITALLVALVMIFALTVPAYANDRAALTQDTPVANQAGESIQTVEYLGDKEYEELLARVNAEAEAAITPELKEKMRVFREEVVDSPELSAAVTSSVRSTLHASNWWYTT